MSALATGWNAGINDWRAGPQPSEFEILQQVYWERWQIYKGTIFADMLRNTAYLKDRRIYKGTGLLWNHTSRVVDFWGAMMYQGVLSTKPGQGAIPLAIGPEMTDDQTNALLAVIDAIYKRWNWQQQMIYRPKMTAALGDCLTELIDDLDKRFVFPRIVWSGFVKTVVLDDSGFLTSYELEYPVTEADDNGAVLDSYTYGKRVTKETFSYFKNGEPFDYYDVGAVVENPYGFVPAIWDRHNALYGVRGDAAIDKSRQQLFSLNSLFSHSRDYQHKAFFAPVVVTGRMSQENETTIDLSGEQQTASAMAQALSFVEAEAGADVKQVTFDVGRTLDMLESIKEGILDNHPEATFFQKLAEATQVTGPGANTIILPVKGMVIAERSGMDANTVRLIQMAISMGGMRVNNGDWGPTSELNRARRAFLPYTLDSYKNEEMEFTIEERDIIAPTEAERLEIIVLKESLQTQWGLEQAGEEPDVAKTILAQKQAALAGGLDIATSSEDLAKLDSEAA
ncbi:MAG TPA: hypothetical protein VFQ54_12460 [Thermomicrobiales bacterium]|nr:hypothetical protein [Thermomicrobiales bacterium]